MKLSLVRLKGEIMIAGVGTLKTTVSSQTMSGVELNITDYGYILGKFKEVQFGIPLENVVVFVIDPNQG
jgi:hypothetical protein